ncbi:MAG: GGDEF domain-containing protein [Lachnospiraceae bacterium]|nr:GGDEF domain-containing protein [Lachnospiraceae bacterium]
MKDRFLGWGSRNRNNIFLYACAVIHLVYLVFFAVIHVNMLVALNIFSVTFYAYMIFSRKSATQGAMVACYFEVLFFTALSSLITHGLGDFIFLDICMITIIFYLAPDFKVPRIILQLIGLLAAFFSLIIGRVSNVIFEASFQGVSRYETLICCTNLFISVVTTVFVSYLYTYELRKAQIEADFNVNHDYLTGLFNRRFFHDYMMKDGNVKPDYVIVMGDIDNFKGVNDFYGHDVGDEVLVRVSECLKKYVSDSDMAVRWGGEEFVLFFNGVSKEKVIEIMEDARDELHGIRIPTRRRELSVTMTFGIAAARRFYTYEDIIKLADLRLYYGKRNGKDCIISTDVK